MDIRDQISRINVGNAIHNVNDRIPKPITPKAHAILDYATAGYFFVLAAVFWKRNRRAATAAAIHGGAVLGASLLTDYPGGVAPVLSFRGHRNVDIAQMALAAAAPAIHGFAGEPEAKYFYAQAANEASVIAMTDWDALWHREAGLDDVIPIDKVA